MAIFAIGDVQGCYDELARLVDKIKFDPAQDELWFVGDLVNRGPKSLKTLRFVKSLGKSAKVVLGNHDLHLLAANEVEEWRAFLCPSLQKIFKVNDSEELLDWLRHRRLAIYRPKMNTLLVHAGVYWDWDPLQTIKLAKEVETTLRGKKHGKFFEKMYGDHPDDWSPTLSGMARLRFITNCLTRVRFCRRDGSLDFFQKGPPGSQHKSLVPWFDLKGRASKSVRIVCGHWSSMGLVTEPNLLMIDTGCVWGQKLTAVRLDGPLRVVSVSAKR